MSGRLFHSCNCGKLWGKGSRSHVLFAFTKNRLNSIILCWKGNVQPWTKVAVCGTQQILCWIPSQDVGVMSLPFKQKTTCFSELSLGATDKPGLRGLTGTLRSVTATRAWRQLHKGSQRRPCGLAGDRWLSPANPQQQLTPGSLLRVVQSHDCTRWAHCLYPGCFCDPPSAWAALTCSTRCNLPFLAYGFHCHDTRGWQRFKREPRWSH